jgi:hypothetical protein
MANASIWLKAFDRERDFLAHKPMRVAGADFLPGQPFDKSLVSTRRLRQLYDSRKVVMVPKDAPAAVAPVEIPENWRDLPWIPKVKGGESLRTVASLLTDKPLKNKAEAFALIDAEVARREAAKQPEPPVNDDGAGEGDGDGETVIPENWRELSVDERIALAVALTGEAIGTDEDAVAAIELELESRKAEADGQSA